MAIIKDAPAMIMDEPTVGLDPQGASEFLQILRQLRDEGKAILMSSHDIFRAKQVADRVGILVRGRLIKLLTSEEIAKEDLERLYLDYVEAYEVTP
jgi:ABC-2 type transport system ATP-binding protein